MPMHMDVAPYNDNDVRLGLKYAMDREHMVKTILRGYGTVANDHPIAPTYQFHASEIPQRQYDPDKAKYHFEYMVNLDGAKVVIGDHVGLPAERIKIEHEDDTKDFKATIINTSKRIPKTKTVKEKRMKKLETNYLVSFRGL